MGQFTGSLYTGGANCQFNLHLKSKSVSATSHRSSLGEQTDILRMTLVLRWMPQTPAIPLVYPRELLVN